LQVALGHPTSPLIVSGFTLRIAQPVVDITTLSVRITNLLQHLAKTPSRIS
jgi:hypothetical protein